MTSSARRGEPQKVVWYWPHPHANGDDVAEILVDRGVEITVECLRSFEGNAIQRAPLGYAVVADLPDVGRDRRRWVRGLQTVRAHLVRARRRDRLVARLAPEVVHLQMTFPPIDALTIPLLRRHGTAVVLVVHDVVSHQGRVPPWLDRAARGRTYRAADGLIVLHPSVGDALEHAFPRCSTPISVVPPVLQPKPAPPSGSGPQRRRFLLFGSMRPNKGLDTVVTALRSIPDPPFEVLVAGAGDASIQSVLRRAAEELPNLVVEIGFASPERKAELFRSSDVILLPYTSAYTSYSAVLRDAYEWGRPVIASDVGMIADEIRRDDSGWLVRPEDPDDLALALVNVATAGDELAGKAANIARGRDRYAAENVATSLAAAYLSALTARRRTAP